MVKCGKLDTLHHFQCYFRTIDVVIKRKTICLRACVQVSCCWRNPDTESVTWFIIVQKPHVVTLADYLKITVKIFNSHWLIRLSVLTLKDNRSFNIAKKTVCCMETWSSVKDLAPVCSLPYLMLCKLSLNETAFQRTAREPFFFE